MDGSSNVPVSRYAQSQRLYEAARQVIAGGVNSNLRLDSTPVPLFFSRGAGAHLWDADGNRYVDYVLGIGPCVLGHAPAALTAALQAALKQGIAYAAQHEAEVALGRLLCEVIPCAELIRLNMTGSEADHAALRAARAFTGRSKIVKFEGHYHGWFDNELISTKVPLDDAGYLEAPRPLAMSRGQATSALSDVIVLPWNDLTAVGSCLASSGSEVAAIIMEPVMCNAGVLPPRPGYLEGVHEMCTRHGVLLIFDEVITGFRLALGGAQGLLGVTPDLAVFGKAMGGGVPVSCLAGRRDIMACFADGSTNHSGTFNGNVLSVAAALATIEELRRDDSAAYRHMENLGRRLMDGLREAGREAGLPLLVQGYPSVFYTAFAEGAPIVDYRDNGTRTDALLLRRFTAGLQDRGVRVVSRGMWLLSAAHTPEDIDRTLEAALATLRDLR